MAMTIQGDTAGASDKVNDVPNLGNCGGKWPGGPDLVYAVTPSASGTLSANLTTNITSAWLHLRKTCSNTKGDEIACDHGGNTASWMYSVNGGTTYYVVVDSWQGASSMFTLTLSLQ
jgi:hypothetical protein